MTKVSVVVRTYNEGRQLRRTLEAVLAQRDVAPEVIVVDSHQEAVKVSDDWAPEHLEVQTQNWQYYLDNCKNYGSIFLGE